MRIAYHVMTNNITLSDGLRLDTKTIYFTPNLNGRKLSKGGGSVLIEEITVDGYSFYGSKQYRFAKGQTIMLPGKKDSSGKPLKLIGKICKKHNEGKSK